NYLRSKGAIYTKNALKNVILLKKISLLDEDFLKDYLQDNKLQSLTDSPRLWVEAIKAAIGIHKPLILNQFLNNANLDSIPEAQLNEVLTYGLDSCNSEVITALLKNQKITDAMLIEALSYHNVRREEVIAQVLEHRPHIDYYLAEYFI